MWFAARLASPVLLILALRDKHWAYGAFVGLSLLYFPARVGFRLHPQACELVPSMRLAIISLQNYPHIVLCAGFYGLSWVQFRGVAKGSVAWAALATLVMAALLELAEGLSGQGYCRLRDLVPDSVGGLLAASVLALWYLRAARRSPGRRGSLAE